MRRLCVQRNFEKVSTANSTAEIYLVVQVQATNPVTYLVEGFMVASKGASSSH